MELMFLLTLTQIRKALDISSKKYLDILLMGDYNVDLKETNMNVFCNQHKLVCNQSSE